MRKYWQVGDQIQGRWEVFKVLEGGAGIVYVVYDHAFHEPFAAKTFRPEIFASSPLIADRFMRESLAWVRLDVHPNIAQARMFERIDGTPYLFLEYVSGGDLAGWIGTPRLTEDLPQVLRFAIQFCDGMIHAQEKGIRAHRDIKPRNCLITHDGTLKVTDFGLAKLFENEGPGQDPHPPAGGVSSSLTRTTVGTCTHMAPEQFLNAGEVDLRADVYSFGVMLHQMICGELPFVGDDWKDLEYMHRNQSPPFLFSTDLDLAKLLQACMAKDPAARPFDFAELRARLGKIYLKVVGSPPLEIPQGAALSAVHWNNKGASLDNLGLHKESITCYETALRLNPKLASAWFNKGLAQFESGQPLEAMECYDRALKLNPKFEQAWSNKGVALKSLGKTQEAVECYNRAIQVNRRYAKAWVNKGVALRSQGALEEALACYERALLLDPRDESGWTNKGNALYAASRVEEALKCYDRALALDSRLDRTWMNKGIALNALGRNDEALQCYGHAIEINPRLAQAWFLHGVTLVNAFQRYQEAIPYFGEAKRLGSPDAEQALELCQSALQKR